MSGSARQIDLLRRLIAIGEGMVESRTTQIADATLRQLREEVETERARLGDSAIGSAGLIGYEAACLVECIAEIAYARTDCNDCRERRAVCYVNTFVGFMRVDIEKAERRLAQQ